MAVLSDLNFSIFQQYCSMRIYNVYTSISKMDNSSHAINFCFTEIFFYSPERKFEGNATLIMLVKTIKYTMLSSLK